MSRAEFNYLQRELRILLIDPDIESDEELVLRITNLVCDIYDDHFDTHPSARQGLG